jgi:hypothetical protein
MIITPKVEEWFRVVIGIGNWEHLLIVLLVIVQLKPAGASFDKISGNDDLPH